MDRQHTVESFSARVLELIDREIERISGITHQMHQLYRRTPQPPSEFQMERVVAEVACLLEHVARKRQVLLKVLPCRVPISVLLPEGEVKQILYNLIRNAVQASPAGETVTIRAKSAGDEIAVSVEDRGAGIEEDVVARIFDPFFTTKQAGPEGGMGLGLSVSRSLIESMGGRIEVSSQSGQGAVFTAVFPRRLGA